MITFLFLLLLAQPKPQTNGQTAPVEQKMIEQISASGRCADLSETPDQRVNPQATIAPGAPPILSFRYYEGKLHQRFGNADLMLDDAGH